MDEDRQAIHDELRRLYPCEDIQDALLGLGLKKTGEVAVLSEIKGWHRSGGETFATYFSLESPEFLKPPRFVLKACCPSSFSDVDKILDKWVLRREFMKANGVETPHLYARGPGVVLEEYVPYSIQDAVRLNHSSPSFKGIISRTYNLIGRMGFKPISLHHNLRSRGNDVVNIDFGSDIGPQSHSSVDLSGLLDKELPMIGY